MQSNVIALPSSNQDVSVLTVHPVNRPDLKTVAFVDIQDGCYRIRGLSVVRHEKGAFVSFPKRKNGQKWFEIIEAEEPRRSQIFRTVLADPRVRELLS